MDRRGGVFHFQSKIELPAVWATSVMKLDQLAGCHRELPRSGLYKQPGSHWYAERTHNMKSFLTAPRLLQGADGNQVRAVLLGHPHPFVQKCVGVAAQPILLTSLRNCL